MALRILVVDDEAIVRETVASMLEHLQLEHKAVANAEEALEVIESYAPGVLIVDLVLPGPMDGLQLIQELMSRLPMLKIIATSGDTESESYFRALRLRGVVHQIEKPITIDNLADAISKATGIDVKDLGEDLIG